MDSTLSMVETIPKKTKLKTKRTTIAAMIVIATTAQAASKGRITITPTKVIVNCPILQWGGDKDNTIPAGHI
jgi:hypothetical protein